MVDGETKYNPIENASFAPAFSEKDIVEASYVGSNGVRYVFDDNLIKGLQEVKKYKKIDQETAEELIIGASSKFDSSIFEFDLKFYADRVIDIAEYVRKNLPYIRPDNGGWLPEEGEAGQGEENPLEGIEINKETSKILYEALHAAQSAKKENFVYEERIIPITPKVVEIIETAYRKFWGTPGSDEPEPDGGTELPIDQPGDTAVPEGGGSPATGGGSDPGSEPVVQTKKKVLIIEDNIEQLKYIEKKRSDESNQITNDNILNGLAEDIKLYQHQKDGVAWILKCWKEGYKGVLLADDMGLGKTAQALAFISGRIKMKYCSKRTRSEAIEINKEIKNLAKKLEGETYHGEHWLLLYEVNRHKLLSDKKYGYKEPEMHDFFKLLCQNNISFYNNE